MGNSYENNNDDRKEINDSYLKKNKNTKWIWLP